MPTTIFAVGGSPVTNTGTLAVTVTGTSGGVPFFSGTNALGSSGALTANFPVIGGGAGVAPGVGTRSGNTTAFVTTTGTQTSGNCVSIDVNGNHVANGSACAGGSVTSVALSVPSSIFSVTGSPITGSGTLGITVAGTSGGIPFFSSTSAIGTSALLAASQIMLGGGAATAPATLGALGTTTTVLHGNAAGAPSFAAVVSADLNLTTTSCTNQYVTALSSGAVGTCSTITLASASFANQGTTTTLLHGNGAGNPSFGSAVSADLNITTTGCTNQFVTAISAGGVGTCTTDTLASAQHANQGTTTTVLHGNASGNPTFGAVSLTADISGILGSANGGTGNGFAKLSGPTTSEKTFTLPDASASILTSNAAVTVGQGGTGQTSTSAGYIKGGATFSVQAVPIPVADGGTGAAAFTLGSVVVAGASGTYVQDNTGLFYDATGHNLLVGATAGGTSLAHGFAMGQGTAPSSAPADLVQFWVEDRNGAGTATPKIMTEDTGGIKESFVVWAQQAKDTTERTTTSTSTVDLSTLTVNIPVGDGFAVQCRYRKTAGNASTASLGVKLNATQVFNNFAVTSSTNQAEDGVFSYGPNIPARPGITNYTHTGAAAQSVSSNAGTLTTTSATTYANAIPSVALTTIVITGQVANAANTLAVKDCTAWRVATQ